LTALCEHNGANRHDANRVCHEYGACQSPSLTNEHVSKQRARWDEDEIERGCRVFKERIREANIPHSKDHV